jgi:hypothetical protein
MNSSQPSEDVARPVDFDLHGIVGVRLFGASERDVAAVARQLGPIRRPLTRDPDIAIRFVERLHSSSPLRYLGVDEVAFDEDEFLVLRSKHKAPARVAIPLDRIGSGLEIVCESGLPAVPLLIPIVNLTALSNGALPLHAAAFVFEGTGVLATGWSKGGKTETLLGFMAQGATYVGDEWVYLKTDGRMYGIPEPIRVWDWHVSELPAFRSRLGLAQRARLGALRRIHSATGALATARGGALPGARALHRVRPLIAGQRFVDARPHELFGAEACALEGRLDRVLFVASHEAPDISVRPADPVEICRRMVFSLEEERARFMTTYHQFRFAFPERCSELVERTEEVQRELLFKVLAGKESHSVHHPYPVSIPALFDAIRSVL